MATGGPSAAEVSVDLDEPLSVAGEAAREGARTAMSWRTRELVVEEKAASADLVSQCDRDTERIIRAVLARHRPGDAVLGEEPGVTEGTGGVRWIVDPIDGTTNYLYGRPDWAVSVAAADAADGTLPAGVVLEPVLGRSTEARRGGGTVADGVRVPLLRQDDLSRALVELNFGRRPQRVLGGPRDRRAAAPGARPAPRRQRGRGARPGRHRPGGRGVGARAPALGLRARRPAGPGGRGNDRRPRRSGARHVAGER
jgi:myo-inositol-1(or 4)-monophosphatase